MTAAAADLRATLRALHAEIPAEQAENQGWPERALPRMLAALGLTEAPAVGWFVDGMSRLYDKAQPEGWRYCWRSDDPERSLYGIAYAGPPPRILVRANLDLAATIRTTAHEAFHVAEFARGDPADEEAADEFGANAAAAFWRSLYR
jgi:hypothetical protein